MKALIDTCVIIDGLQDRRPFSQMAASLFMGAAGGLFEGCIGASSVCDIYYLEHRYRCNDSETRAELAKLFEVFTIIDTQAQDCLQAICSPMGDFEDAVLAEAALREGCDCIVTRNERDFCAAPLPVYTPKEFIDRL